MSEEFEEIEFIRANKPLFMEYFGYDADKNRADLLRRIETRQKIRRL